MILGAVWLGLAAVAAGQDPGPAPSSAPASPREPRTVQRQVDVVVIQGSALGARILGAPKDELRVYACRAGAMVPIVYQVDERNAAGKWCYDQGPAEHRLRDEDGGQVDANDELCVLIRDAGDRAPPELIGTVQGQTAVQELELRDPIDQSKAWIYLYRFQGTQAPAPVDTDLVSLSKQRIDDERGVYTWAVEGAVFNNGRSPFNAVRATYASFRQPDGGMSPSLLDCTVVRAVVSFMWVTVTRESADIRVVIGGYIDGPIRVIAQNLLQVYLALSVWVSAPDSYIILWPNRVSMPTNVTCPVNLDEDDESSYTLCWDMSRRVRGWFFYNSRNANPVAIDGRWSPEERKLDMGFPDWNVTYGPEGAMISKFVIPQAIRGRRTNRLVYVDDNNHRLGEKGDGAEFEPGAYGLNGYYIDMSGLKEGLYTGDYVVWYVPPPFKPGDERPFLAEYERPVQARATSD